jgi:CheY-like chemotaxis protein/HPt (histidine-containing phosphotransfer) domain-containing protein
MEGDSVADGRHALEQLRTEQRNGQPYALVLFDMYLPDMDGLTLARAIKADPTLASVRLVMLTSFGQRGQAADAQQEGIAAYLTKPVRQSQLYNCFVMLMSSLAELPGASPITRHRIAEAKAQIRVRVLVAEDNIVNQRVAVRMLEQLGCRIDVAANGREAVEASARIPYDLIFMDCQMPDMDGYAATAAIRARETLTGIHIPIIAMTANAMQGDREQCLQAGMDDYVSKPVKTENLLEILQQWASQAAGTSPVPDTAVTGTSTPAPQEEESALCAQPFAALKELCDDEDPAFLLDLIKTYLQDTATHIATLRSAVFTRDARSLERTAHSLKSSSANIGALGMADLCGTLQTLGQAGSVPQAIPLVEQLTAEFDCVQKALYQECAAMQAPLADEH